MMEIKFLWKEAKTVAKWSINHKSILALLSIIILIFGGFSLVQMERQENPAVVSPICTIKTIYPGASSQDVEKQIIKPIEDEVGTLSEIKHIESYAMDSVGIIKVTLKDMSDADINTSWDKVREKVDLVKTELPAAAEEPKVETDFTSSYGLIIGISSEQYHYKDMIDNGNMLADAIKKIDTVKAVDIDGAVEEQIVVELNMTKLMTYKISPKTIQQVIQARNINIPGGNLKVDENKVPVQITGEYGSIDELKNTIVDVSRESGTPVYLKDIAQVNIVEESDVATTYINGEKGILVGVQYMDGVNVIREEQRVQEVVQSFIDTQLYAGMHMNEVYNEVDFVQESISLFSNNLLSAIFLILIVVLITMGVRSAIVVALPIPLITCIVLGYMYISGIPLHQVSIASLIISLSLMVANGIVVNDNIQLYLQEGKTREQACTDGVEDVKIPILTSTLTTIASFLPLAMMQGSAGKFVNSLPILVAVALIGSLVTSISIVPALGYSLTKSESEVNIQWMAKTKERLHLDHVMNRFQKRYGQVLKRSLTHPKKVLLLFGGIFILSLVSIKTLSIQLFPPVEREQYVLNITTSNSVTISNTENICQEIAQVLDQESSVNDFSYKVGDGYMKYYITFFPNDLASNKAQFLIDGTRSEAKNVEKRIQEAVPGVLTNIKYLEISLPSNYPIEVRISGPDINQLRHIAEDMEPYFRSVEGLKNIENNFGYNGYKLNIQVNEEKANMVGISNYEIASTVRMAVNGLEISELKQKDIKKDPLPIILKMEEENKGEVERLQTIFISSQLTNENIPLTEIATIDTDTSFGKIIRRDGERTITVGAFVNEGYNTNSCMQQLQAKLETYSLPDGYFMVYGGENETSEEAFSSMKVPTVIACILIYLILVFQFGDLREPFLIMGTIPLSFIGIIWGLKIMKYPIGFMALLGGISLMGVVVNNGIVLLDYIKVKVQQEDNRLDAITQACKTRLRPIMIGMITTVISLLPLMISGGALWAPMATSIIFGMLLSSVLTLIVIPCGYLLLVKE